MVDRKDLRIDVYDARDGTTGASDWAIRVTHVPSGRTAQRSGEGANPDDRKLAIQSAIRELEDELAR